MLDQFPGPRLCEPQRVRTSKCHILFHTYFDWPKCCGSQTRAPLFYATRNTGASQDLTDLAAAVQLRLRVAFGLQALQRCSGLLNRRARGSTVAAHHLGSVECRMADRFASHRVLHSSFFILHSAFKRLP